MFIFFKYKLEYMPLALVSKWNRLQKLYFLIFVNFQLCRNSGFGPARTSVRYIQGSSRTSCIIWPWMHSQRALSVYHWMSHDPIWTNQNILGSCIIESMGSEVPSTVEWTEGIDSTGASKKGMVYYFVLYPSSIYGIFQLLSPFLCRAFLF